MNYWQIVLFTAEIALLLLIVVGSLFSMWLNSRHKADEMYYEHLVRMAQAKGQLPLDKAMNGLQQAAESMGRKLGSVPPKP